MNKQITVKGNKLFSLQRLKMFFYQYYKNKGIFIMFLIPLIFYIIFKYGPMYGILIAFKDFRFTEGILGSPWIGLEHFEYLFAVPSFWQVLRNTLLISLYKLIFGFPAPIALAILINEVGHKYFKKTVQSISYLPHFLSWVILGGIFLQILSPSTGIINEIIKFFGFKPVYFLADPKWFRSVVVVTKIWQGLGWGTIVYLASLSAIDPNLYEAAEVDGANRFQKMFHITLPSLVPVITIMLILHIGKLITDDFTQILNLLVSPTVYEVGDVLQTFIYRTGLMNMQFSFAAAVGLFRNIVAFILVIGANTIARKTNEYALW